MPFQVWKWPRLTINLPWIAICLAFSKNYQIANAISINHKYIHAWLLNIAFLSLLIIWKTIRQIHAGIYITLFLNLLQFCKCHNDWSQSLLMGLIVSYPLMSLTINGSAWNVLKENAFYFEVIRHSILRKIDIYKKILLWYQKSSM